MDSDLNRAAAASSDAQLKDAVRDREELPRPSPPAIQPHSSKLATPLAASSSICRTCSLTPAKYTLRPLAREKLAKISGIVLAIHRLSLPSKAIPTASAPNCFNQDLSEKRAEGVRTYLTQQGVPEGSTTATGFGKTRPIASNDTSEGRQQNRRVELIVSGEVIGTKIVSLSLQPVAAVTSPQ